MFSKLLFIYAAKCPLKCTISRSFATVRFLSIARYTRSKPLGCLKVDCQSSSFKIHFNNIFKGSASYAETESKRRGEGIYLSDEEKEEPPPKKPKKLSVFQRFKSMYRDYWYVLIPVHLATTLFWFSTFYYIVDSGVDVAAIAEKINLSDSIIEKLKIGDHSFTANLAISYAMFKIITPIRYAVTIGGTTLSINYLKKWGCIKPMPKKTTIKKIISDKSASLKEQGHAVTSYVVQKLTHKKN